MDSVYDHVFWTFFWVLDLEYWIGIILSSLEFWTIVIWNRGIQSVVVACLSVHSRYTFEFRSRVFVCRT